VFVLIWSVTSGFIGGWLLFPKLWWRLFARRVTGVTIGKRQRLFRSVGYQAVYRYTDSAGQLVRCPLMQRNTRCRAGMPRNKSAIAGHRRLGPAR